MSNAADCAIGDLTQVASIGDTDKLPIEQNGEAKYVSGEQLKKYVTIDVVNVTASALPAGSKPTAVYNTITKSLVLGIPQGDQGEPGAPNALSIGTVTDGANAAATITGDAPKQTLNLTLPRGETGEAAPTIVSMVARQSDYHLIVTLSDGTEFDAGALPAGQGSGDMLAATYDPQGKATDIFKAIALKQDTITPLGILKNTASGIVAASSASDYAAPPTLTSVTLAAASWSATDKTQTVSVSGVLLETSPQVVTVSPNLANQEAYLAAGVRCTAQAAGKLTFTADTVPTDDLTVYIKMEVVVKA